MYENNEQSREELVVVCVLSTVMDDVEKQLDSDHVYDIGGCGLPWAKPR
jgi:hypothetical protein